jgi:excisionase family DNA binding protein
MEHRNVDDSVPGEKLLTKCEVAQLCRVEIRTVDRWVAAGKLTCYRTPGGRLLFRKRDLLKMADRLQHPVDSIDGSSGAGSANASSSDDSDRAPSMSDQRNRRSRTSRDI